MHRYRRLFAPIFAATLLLTAGAAWVKYFGNPIASLVPGAAVGELPLLRVKGGGLNTVDVSNTAELLSALRAAGAGDVIRLAPGAYSDFTLKGVTFETSVTITSADAADRAVLTDFSINRVTGLTFSNLEFATPSDVTAKGGKYWAFSVANSQDIHFDRISVHGSLDGDASNDVQGLSILNSSHVSVTNSEFQQLERALAVGSSEHINVSGNRVHHLRSDGFDFAEVGHVQLRGNVFSDFTPAEKDHPDAIQFWTSGTTKPSHDILVSGNVIFRGEGASSQGIFFRDQTKALPFERVTISDNLLVNTGYNAIALNGMKGVTISNNVLVSAVGEDTTWLLVRNSDGVVATGNRAASIGFDSVTNLTDTNNIITKGVSDLGAAAVVKDWLQANPQYGHVADQLKSLMTTDLSGVTPDMTQTPVVQPAVEFDLANGPIIDLSVFSGLEGYVFL